MENFRKYKKAPDINRGLFVFIVNLSAVATSQDEIIEALEAEIIKLKTQLSDTEEKYHKMRKKFDDLMIKMHGGGRK